MQKRCLWILSALFWGLSCTIPQARLSPPPSQIKGIEGYASLKISGDQGSARSKFSFLFQLPHQGRIEVSNILGKTLYQIVIQEKEAFFLIPSKKIYWRGEEEQIIDRFLGFRLNLHELVSILSGRWKERGKKGSDYGQEEWLLEKDEEGRIRRGQRGDLDFEVIEFFKNTDVARRLAFHHPVSQGRITILQLRFNRPVKGDLFSLQFLKSFQPKTWKEIEEMLSERR